MKKGLKIGAASLAALLVFGVAGCGKISDADGKKWAEDNGYVKAENAGELPAPVDYEKNAACDTDDTATLYSNSCAGINYENITEYLDREDVDYIDLQERDAYYKGHLKGFRNVEFFSKIYPSGGGAGDTQLFYEGADGRFAPRYVNSVEILETLFPKDKTLFLMCGGGVRVVPMMQLLKQYGWDMSKVYNVGGMSHYTVQNGYTDGEYLVRLNTTEDAYTVYTGSATGKSQPTVQSDDLKITVNVLYHEEDNKIGGVYIVADDVQDVTDHASEAWEAGVNELLSSFEGLTIEEARAKVVTNGSNKELAPDVDVIADATNSSQVVYEAVIDALKTIA